ncbi:hypothetical protein CDAR_63411 [Caerostris darwini]|uniref:Uncharacterized protein n=1 Tax=Caerostris darwini TaxID=1538125 RepID=A0AAV4QQ10_9ARAC|nr:hypothetical protein CDAR_63411 [Caerostris darwini]
MNGGVLEHPGRGEAFDCVSHSSFLRPCVYFSSGADVRGRGGERGGDGTLEGTIRRGGEWKHFFWEGRRWEAAEGSEMNGGVLKHPGRDGRTRRKLKPPQVRVKSSFSRAILLFFDLLYIFLPGADVRGRGGERGGDGTLEGTIRRGGGSWKQLFWEGRRLKAEEGSEMNGGVLKHPGRDEVFDCVVIACLFHCSFIQYLSLNFR